MIVRRGRSWAGGANIFLAAEKLVMEENSSDITEVSRGNRNRWRDTATAVVHGASLFGSQHGFPLLVRDQSHTRAL